MRCCANCEWSISPDLEDEIMEEQGYDEEDNRPHAGDCAIGMIPNKNYVCDKHNYKDGMEEDTTHYSKETDDILIKKLMKK